MGKVRASDLDWGSVFDAVGQQEEMRMGGMGMGSGVPLYPGAPINTAAIPSQRNSELPMYQMPVQAPVVQTDMIAQVVSAVMNSLSGAPSGGTNNATINSPVQNFLKNSSKGRVSGGANPNEAGLNEFRQKNQEVADFENFVKSLDSDEIQNLAYIRDKGKFLISDERLFEIGKSGKVLDLNRLSEWALVKSESMDGFTEYRITSRGKRVCEYLGV